MKNQAFWAYCLFRKFKHLTWPDLTWPDLTICCHLLVIHCQCHHPPLYINHSSSSHTHLVPPISYFCPPSSSLFIPLYPLVFHCHPFVIPYQIYLFPFILIMYCYPFKEFPCSSQVQLFSWENVLVVQICSFSAEWVNLPIGDFSSGRICNQRVYPVLLTDPV